MTPKERLEAIVSQHGTARAAAVALGVSREAVSGALAGRLTIGPKLQRALGIPADEPASARRRRKAKARVLAAVREHSGPMMTGEVAEALGMLEATARTLLHDLKREQLVRRIGYRWTATNKVEA